MSEEAEAKTNVLEGRFRTGGDIPVTVVREHAEQTCGKLICIGIDKDGKLFYSASFGDAYLMLWLIEQFKAKLISGNFIGQR